MLFDYFWLVNAFIVLFPRQPTAPIFALDISSVIVFIRVWVIKFYKNNKTQIHAKL